VEPVVSTMGFAGLDEGNGDAGQHGQSRCPGVNNDMVPVLGVHGSPVQGDADRCGQATTPGTLADDDEGSGPKHSSSGPGGLLVIKERSLGKTNAGEALVPKSISKVHGQHGQSSTSGTVADADDGSGVKRGSFGWAGLLVNEGLSTPTMMGLTFQYPVRWTMISMGGQRQRARATEGSVISTTESELNGNVTKAVPTRSGQTEKLFGSNGKEMTSKQPMMTNKDARAGGDASSSSTQPSRAEVEWRRRRSTTTTNEEHGGVDAGIAGETSSTTTTSQVRPRAVRLPSRCGDVAEFYICTSSIFTHNGPVDRCV